MNELCEKHLQTLKKQIGDVNATGYRQPPVIDRYRARPATGYRQASGTDSHLPEPKFQDKQEEGNERYK